MNRGVLYIKWGGEAETESLWRRSVESLAEWHPELPVHTETLPPDATLLDKSRMYDLSPFDETLFLDIDTVVMGDLSFGFRQAGRFGLACCINECPWARRFDGLKDHGDIVEYNTGVLFFKRSSETKSLFDSWRWYADRLDSRLPFIGKNGGTVMPLNDQPSFAAAVAEWDRTPAVLPLNWNFRPTWHLALFGPIKVYHERSAPSQSMRDFTAAQSNPENVIQFGRVRR